MTNPLRACVIAVTLAAALVLSPSLSAAQDQATEQPSDQAAGQKIKLIARAEDEINGFRAIALVTDDEAWLEKFQNPGENGPKFDLAPRLQVGKPARLLIFFSGAFPSDNRVNVLCDLRLTQGGAIVHDTEPTVCSDAADPGEKSNLILADTSLVITPTEEDMGKLLHIEVGVTDGIRNAFVPLELTVFYAKSE